MSSRAKVLDNVWNTIPKLSVAQNRRRVYIIVRTIATLVDNRRKKW
jgi:hypothetical protein